jgi:hypothetical protein
MYYLIFKDTRFVFGLLQSADEGLGVSLVYLRVGMMLLATGSTADLFGCGW